MRLQTIRCQSDINKMQPEQSQISVKSLYLSIIILGEMYRTMDGYSRTPKEERLNILQSVMPEIFDEGKIDWEKLRAALGENVNFADERYRLNWAGKSDAFRVMQEASAATLVPCREESVDFDSTQNIFIEGENMEVLKVLQKSYFGKVKMIYIDPPYNTGNDSFIYPDRFAESREEYMRRVGDMDEEGYLLRDGMFRKNSRENGQYHSNWLNMMMPRLYLAKSLLREDGVIFVSINDNEVHNLRLLMNEVFGEDNFIEIFSWVKTSTPPGLSNKTRKTIEYILTFEKVKNNNKYKGELLDGGDQPLLNAGNNKRILTFPKDKVVFKIPDGEYDAGIYDRVRLMDSIQIRNGMVTSDFQIEGEFKWTQATLDTEILDGTTFVVKSDKFAIRFIRNKEIGYKAPTNLLKDKYITPIISKKENDVDTNEQSTAELEELLGGKYFSFPKPVSLVKHIANFVSDSDKEAIILDFFAGSGTTAHAVMQLNREDGGNRKYICVQLPEPCDENSEAYKAGYRTIADIAKERIRRAGAKIRAEIETERKKQNEQLDFDDAKEVKMPDLGFKVFKLADSNFKQWRRIRGSDRETWQQQMMEFIDPVAENATIGNMVYEILLKSGKDLNSAIEHKENYYAVNGGELILMLESTAQETIDAVLAARPKKVLALDRLFEGNDQLKTNTVLQMKDAGITFITI